jgi:hypothetical protein
VRLQSSGHAPDSFQEPDRAISRYCIAQNDLAILCALKVGLAEFDARLLFMKPFM